MSLAIGTQLGPYEVLDLLGAGAMGEVYRARDTRLRRQVALKVLPPAISEDPVRLKRFEQEARAAGALNHPNIVAIHDVGNQEGAPYVVSELLEGGTLRERMGGTALPARKALEYGVQIARGLAAAHDKGVVHRDLKPDNIFITHDGGVKILDFGLARVDRVFEEEITNEAEARALTGSGTVLGTVGYMSPEQVRGDKADHRSDVFALGAVLYEMLTGKRAFKGRSAVETMNAILKEDPPPLTQTNPGLPPALERLVDHCLEKSPAERFQSARDLAFDLEALATSSGSAPRPVLAARARWRRMRPAVAAAAIVALPAAGFLLAHATSHHPNPEYQRLTFRRGTVFSGRLAPDGQVVYSAAWDGRPGEVYVRRPETPEARPLGIRQATVAGVSPAGELALLLFTDGKAPVLARASINGGPPREVLEDVLWADWAADGSDFAVVRQAEGRYALEYPLGQVLQRAAAPNFFTHPRISPDGKVVAYLEHPIPGDDRGAVAVVDRSGRKTVLSSGWASTSGIAWSADGGEVLFTATRVGADAALYAVDLSGRRRLVEKAPGRLVLLDASPDGRILLERNSTRVEMRGVREGQEEQDLSWFDISSPVDLSADGERVLFYESGEGGGEGYSVYLRPTSGELPVRLGQGRGSALSPDGKTVISITLDDPPVLAFLPTGAGETRTVRHPQIEAYRWAAFSPDGQKVVFAGTEPGRRVRIYVHDLATGAMRPATPEGVGGWARTITPDGRFIVGITPGEPDSHRLYPLDGGEPSSLAGLERGDQALRWDTEGTGLYVLRGGRPLDVFRVDVQTGARTKVRSFLPADQAGVDRIGGVVMTADAKTFVYSYGRSLSDLYLVRGLK